MLFSFVGWVFGWICLGFFFFSFGLFLDLWVFLDFIFRFLNGVSTNQRVNFKLFTFVVYSLQSVDHEWPRGAAAF